jgi:hypothetical protein
VATPLPLGIVLPDLSGYREIVHAVASSRHTQDVEFTYRAPIFKGNDAIVEGLKSANGALEKFDVYFNHAIGDETERVRFAQEFRKRYLSRFPRSEGQDVFRASREVLQFRFILKNPGEDRDRADVARALKQFPHDKDVLAHFEDTGHIDASNRTGYLALFLDHVHNPTRRSDPRVQEVMYGPREKDPVIIELMTNGALPGLFGHVVGPLVYKVHGAIVFLEDWGDGRQ